MRWRIKGQALCLMMAVLAGSALTSTVWAGDHDFDVTIVYRLTSLQQAGDQLFIEAEGGGVSRILGPLTATASVIQSTVADPCFQFSADFDLVAEDGTIRIHSEGVVCSPPTQIAAAWVVTGGTGAFAGATGSGTEQGKYSFSGSDPVVDRLEGTLSY